MGAVLAIDFGTKRIGLAVTDPERRFLFPRDTLLRTSAASDMDAIAALCAEDAVELLVMGLPLNADGSLGPMVRAARDFGEELSRRTELPLVYVDERYSSIEADERLREAHGRNTRKRKALRDRAAATIILRTFLDDGPYRGDLSQGRGRHPGRCAG